MIDETDVKAVFLAAMFVINMFGIPISIFFMLQNIKVNDATLAVTSLLLALVFALNILAIIVGLTKELRK